MPRIPTPKGYYTSTEALKVLNVSAAMLRIHVQKGRVQYLLPPGRKQGFYLKKDVDNLSNEMTAFLDIDVDREYKFLPAKEEDLSEIVRISNLLFPDDKPPTDEDYTVPEWRRQLLEKNPEAQFVLKNEKETIGVVTMLPLKTSYKHINELLVTDSVSEAKLTKDDMETFETGKHLNIYIVSIGVVTNAERGEKRHYGAKLISNVIHKLVEIGSRGAIIEKIMATGDTHTGVKILQSFGLHEIPLGAPKKRTFIMDIQESGSHVSMQYKEALEASRASIQT